jgi:phage terminase large subunit-like protein
MTTIRRLGTKRSDIPTYFYPYLRTTLDEAEAQIRSNIVRRKGVQTPIPVDIVEWAAARFYIPATGKPITLYPHQQAVLRLALTRDGTGNLPFRTFIYSTIKQSGKSTMAGLVMRWYAETGQRHSEIYAIGNDKEQAKTRGFREARRSIELAPGYDTNHERLPGEWNLMKESMTCVRTGTEIRALAVDAKGEAGGKPAVQAWTETWGAEFEDARRFWEELTPIPTIPDSLRMVETYAGFTNESELLFDLYETGKEGHQLSAGELAHRTGAPLGAFHEATRSDDPVPIWENKKASLLMYWDSGLSARRMPWQVDERGEAYYVQQEETLPVPAFRRLHMNEWSSAETSFIAPEVWDACTDEGLPPLLDGDRTPIVIGVDAGTTLDCFAIVAVSRHPSRPEDVAVRALKIIDPKIQGGPVDYAEAVDFLRQAAKLYNVIQICYDPYQLESVTQTLRSDGVAWCEPFSQGIDRLKADRQLYDLIIQRRIAHTGDLRLREHVLNAAAKVQKDMDSTLRLVKASPRRSIDAAVALSMAAARCLYLRL